MLFHKEGQKQAEQVIQVHLTQLRTSFLPPSLREISPSWNPGKIIVLGIDFSTKLLLLLHIFKSYLPNKESGDFFSLETK